VKPLATGPVARNCSPLFQLSEEAKKTGNLPDGSKAPSIDRAAVIGAGVMGGGIAGLMAERRLDVRLRDLDRAQLDAAVVAHRAEVDKKRKRHQLRPHQADAAIDRLTATTDARGFARCELALEAVAEKLEVKRAVLRDLAAQMGDGAILATNTSSLSGGRDRRRAAGARARRRDALLQPAAQDAAGRGRARAAHVRGGRAAHRAARARPRQDAGHHQGTWPASS
jgi:3-hydroxyisobutyrate dehydrogenase-like beta-hydroxyacid dehydrogenase